MSADIQNRGWIQKFPVWMRPYIYLGRFDRPIGIWLLLLPGWWSIALSSEAVFEHWDLYILFGVGAIVMRAAGCVMNDIWDRDIDKQVERTRLRPLASGDITLKQSGAFLIVLLLVGLGILLQMNGLTIFLGVLSLPFIVVYPLMKRVTWWPQLFLGITFNFGALMGWSAVAGEVSFPAFLLYAGGIFWTLGYDTIYAHQDKEDDALIGVKSTALKLGDHSRSAVILFYVLQSFFWGGALFFGAGWIGVAGLVPVVVHLVWQVRSWNLDDSESCLAVFKSNRDLGFLALLMMILVHMF